MTRAAVIGAGAWGTTLSVLLAEKGHEVTLWAYEKEIIPEMLEYRENKRFLPGFPIPAGIGITNEVAALKGADLYFFVVPAQFLRATAQIFSDSIPPSALVVSASKGIEEKTLKLPLQILQEKLKTGNLAVLSGPNLSSEIARGLPAAAVAASADKGMAKKVQESLLLERFRVYTSSDPVGVQLGGALKNIIAVAAGIADGLELGDNARAGLMVRGMVEITRLGIALGSRAETFAGLSGMGDLFTTCGSRLSRNHQVGEKIAQGKKLPEILSQMKEVAEGVPTCLAAVELAKKHKVPMPIAEEVYNVLYTGKDPRQAIFALMTRTATSE